MAKRIEGPYDFSSYSFSTYSDGATWELTEGEDFGVRPKSLLDAARKWAKAEGLEIETKLIDATSSRPAIVALRFRKANMLKRAS